MKVVASSTSSSSSSYYSPCYDSIESAQDGQGNGISLFVSRQPSESRRKHDLDKEQRVADGAGQHVRNPASAFVFFGALIEADIIVGLSRLEWMREAMYKPSERPLRRDRS